MIDFFAISPFLIILGGALLLLLVESFFENAAKKISFPLVCLILFSALFVSQISPESQDPLLTRWLKFDSLSRVFNALFICIGLGSAFLASSFFKRFEATHGEYYFLQLSALFGLMLIGSSADFLTLFIGIETLSISLYVLCGYMKKWVFSRESSLKYFLMGSLAAAFLLYGIAFIYGAIGTTQFSALKSSPENFLFLTGISFVTLALCFEAAIVPFQVWAPDVYEGAPTPVTAFMSVGTKAGAFAAFVRIFLESLHNFNPLWNEGIALLAIATLIFSNFVALRQTHLRRFFAYSGMSHAGFMLIAIAAGSTDALLFYVIVYTLATLGAFAAIAFIDTKTEGVLLKDLYGLYHKSPAITLLLTLSLLTLAGIPPTAGFFAKFYIFKVAFQAGFYTLIIVALLTTILSAYYYLRIIMVMFTKGTEEAFVLKTHTAAIVGAFCFAALVILTIYPSLGI